MQAQDEHGAQLELPLAREPEPIWPFTDKEPWLAQEMARPWAGVPMQVLRMEQAGHRVKILPGSCPRRRPVLTWTPGQGVSTSFRGWTPKMLLDLGRLNLARGGALAADLRATQGLASKLLIMVQRCTALAAQQPGLIWPDCACHISLRKIVKLDQLHPSGHHNQCSSVLHARIYHEWSPEMLPRSIHAPYSPDSQWIREMVAGRPAGQQAGSGFSFLDRSLLPAGRLVPLQGRKWGLVRADLKAFEVFDDLFDAALFLWRVSFDPCGRAHHAGSVVDPRGQTHPAQLWSRSIQHTAEGTRHLERWICLGQVMTFVRYHQPAPYRAFWRPWPQGWARIEGWTLDDFLRTND